MQDLYLRQAASPTHTLVYQQPDAAAGDAEPPHEGPGDYEARRKTVARKQQRAALQAHFGRQHLGTRVRLITPTDSEGDVSVGEGDDSGDEDYVPSPKAHPPPGAKPWRWGWVCWVCLEGGHAPHIAACPPEMLLLPGRHAWRPAPWSRHACRFFLLCMACPPRETRGTTKTHTAPFMLGIQYIAQRPVTARHTPDHALSLSLTLPASWRG